MEGSDGPAGAGGPAPTQATKKRQRGGEGEGALRKRLTRAEEPVEVPEVRKANVLAAVSRPTAVYKAMSARERAQFREALRRLEAAPVEEARPRWEAAALASGELVPSAWRLPAGSVELTTRWSRRAVDTASGALHRTDGPAYVSATTQRRGLRPLEYTLPVPPDAGPEVLEGFDKARQTREKWVSRKEWVHKSLEVFGQEGGQCYVAAALNCLFYSPAFVQRIRDIMDTWPPERLAVAAGPFDETHDFGVTLDQLFWRAVHDVLIPYDETKILLHVLELQFLRAGLQVGNLEKGGFAAQVMETITKHFGLSLGRVKNPTEGLETDVVLVSSRVPLPFAGLQHYSCSTLLLSLKNRDSNRGHAVVLANTKNRWGEVVFLNSHTVGLPAPDVPWMSTTQVTYALPEVRLEQYDFTYRNMWFVFVRTTANLDAEVVLWPPPSYLPDAAAVAGCTQLLEGVRATLQIQGCVQPAAIAQTLRCSLPEDALPNMLQVVLHQLGAWGVEWERISFSPVRDTLCFVEEQEAKPFPSSSPSWLRGHTAFRCWTTSPVWTDLFIKQGDAPKPCVREAVLYVFPRTLPNKILRDTVTNAMASFPPRSGLLSGHAKSSALWVTQWPPVNTRYNTVLEPAQYPNISRAWLEDEVRPCFIGLPPGSMPLRDDRDSSNWQAAALNTLLLNSVFMERIDKIMQTTWSPDRRKAAAAAACHTPTTLDQLFWRAVNGPPLLWRDSTGVASALLPDVVPGTPSIFETIATMFGFTVQDTLEHVSGSSTVDFKADIVLVNPDEVNVDVSVPGYQCDTCVCGMSIYRPLAWVTGMKQATAAGPVASFVDHMANTPLQRDLTRVPWQGSAWDVQAAAFDCISGNQFVYVRKDSFWAPPGPVAVPVKPLGFGRAIFQQVVLALDSMAPSSVPITVHVAAAAGQLVMATTKKPNALHLLLALASWRGTPWTVGTEVSAADASAVWFCIANQKSTLVKAPSDVFRLRGAAIGGFYKWDIFQWLSADTTPVVSLNSAIHHVCCEVVDVMAVYGRTDSKPLPRSDALARAMAWAIDHPEAAPAKLFKADSSQVVLERLVAAGAPSA
jgi:hypothetical protein